MVDGVSRTQSNPYQAPTSTVHPHGVPQPPRKNPRRFSWRLIFQGALWSIGLSFPIAAAMALVYRFPVPFAGYLSGVDAIIPAMIAVAFYGMLGGFIILGIVGAIGGWMTGFLSFGTQRTMNLMLIACSATVTTIGLFVLAILDKIIGPW